LDTIKKIINVTALPKLFRVIYILLDISSGVRKEE